MLDFLYYAPTEIFFGPDSESHLVSALKKHNASRLMLHYGGGSAVRSGLIPRIRQTLENAGIEYVEAGGVKPNPRLSLVRECIKMAREHRVDMILAVGGGSVIDSAKAIAYGACLPPDGPDVWSVYSGKTVPEKALPIGVVLTIPAAGSEMSNSSVITNDTDGNLKVGYNNNLVRPAFAILNPRLTFTLPPYQTACGVVDIIMHTFERYFGRNADQPLTDALAEALVRKVMEYGPVAVREPENYTARAVIMWSASLSHNDVTGDRTGGDWASHKLEHELSGMWDVAHGAGLAVTWPAWACFALPHRPERCRQFLRNVLDVKDADSIEHPAEDLAARMSAFFSSLDMPATISQMIGRKATEEEISTMADRVSAHDTVKVGRVVPIGHREAALIYHNMNL
ncbi:MAG: iron-containing alcohol dehydrogenase [Muribaculaceae bacterium]|nr:iron-containing alcohol dehydrogenase [Muribaculaceae bacterium]